MSAIAGIFHQMKKPISPLDDGNKLIKALENIPADDIQTWQQENIFLGCHAQWITPESIGEKLPFYDDQRQLAITADAIIDNREELLERLQIDYRDRAMITDSQLILLAYHKWGEETPTFLLGDFAFMIWDKKQRRLFGARDYSGKRTLYYSYHQQVFLFCTLMNPLLILPYIKNTLNEDWIADFLAIPGFFESIDPHATVYKDIYQLPPSHAIIVTDSRVKFMRYSHLSADKKLKLKSNQEYEEAFRDVFDKAVHSALRTHRQIGSQLSGGLDSSSVASFAANTLRKEKQQLHTFSYVPVDGFKDWTHKSRIANERPQIEAIVQHLGNHSANYFSFSERNAYTEIDRWLDTIEMPYKSFENSFWISGIYEEVQKQGIGVLLSGKRGNWSISWGPAIEYYAWLLKRVKWLRLYQEIYQYCLNMGTGRKRVLSVVSKKAFPMFYSNHHTPEDDFPIFINPDFAHRSKVRERLMEHDIDLQGRMHADSYKIRMQQFQQLYYWNTTGTIGAKFALHHHMAERDPTNDLRVVKFCLSVPEDQFVQNGFSRSLVRRAMEGYLPDEIRLNLKTKGIQGADGVQRMKPIWGTFINELEQLKKSPMMQEFLNIEVIEKCLSVISNEPKAEWAYDFELKVLMRSLILYRFLKKSASALM